MTRSPRGRIGLTFLALAVTVVPARLFAQASATAAARGGAGSGELLVSAAASLSDVLPAIARTFESVGGERVALNFGGSNALVWQVRAGAPVDVFVSADDAQLVALGALARAESRIEVASNQLAIVVPDDRPSPWTSIELLLNPQVRRVAVGDPAAVPAGVYAREYLTRIGLWARIQPKVVPTGSVRLALAAVESAAADAAIVYRTDAAAARRSKTAWLVPVADGPAIGYAAVGLRDAPNAAGAARFLRFLASTTAQAVLTKAGFGPPRSLAPVRADQPRQPVGRTGARP